MIIITADWHLDQKTIRYNENVRSKAQDIEEVAKQIGEYADVENCLIIAGDLFDNDRPRPEAVTLFRYLYDTYLKEFRSIILVLGNHDSSDTTDDALHLVEAWKEPNIKIVRTLKGSRLKDEGKLYKTVFVPHLSKKIFDLKPGDNYEDALTDKLVKFKKVMEAADLVVGHGTISGAKMGTEQFSLRRAIMLPTTMKAVTVLGHIHKPQSIRANTFYVGAPIYTDFAEIKDVKQFGLITRGKYSIVPIKGVQQYSEVKLNQTQSAVLKMPKVKRGSYIYKIVVETTKALRSKINTVMIEDKFNEFGFVQSLVFQIKGEEAEEAAAVKDRSTLGMTPLKILQKYLTKTIKDSKKCQVVHNKGKETLHKVA